MANMNTFPHVNADVINLDWLLEQYATFNDRIAEILAHFDEVAENMAQQNERYKSEILALFNNYKNYVDAKISSINNAIEQISDNVSGYVADHMAEWQLESMVEDNNDIIIGDYDPTAPIAVGGTTTKLIINNTEYKLGGVSFLFDALFHVTHNVLAAVTAGTVTVDIPDDSELSEYIDNIGLDHLENVNLNYTMNFDNSSYSNDSEYEKIKSISFRTGALNFSIGTNTNYSLKLYWARNASSTISGSDLVNGLYLTIGVVVPNF